MEQSDFLLHCKRFGADKVRSLLSAVKIVLYKKSGLKWIRLETKNSCHCIDVLVFANVIVIKFDGKTVDEWIY